MADNKEYFVLADTPCGGHFTTTVEAVEILEPDERSEVLVQTREEFLAEGSYADEHHEWVITLEQENGNWKSSKARLFLCDDTVRKLVEKVYARLRETPIERDPHVEQQLEEEYAECDG
jgi:hypothetical protein